LTKGLAFGDTPVSTKLGAGAADTVATKRLRSGTLLPPPTLPPAGRLQGLGALLQPLASLLEPLASLLEPLASLLEALGSLLEAVGSLLEAVS
jgi:hypothetical protein